MNLNYRPARNLVSNGLCAVLLSAGCASAALAATFELPPLCEPSTAEHHVGKVVWVDLVTPDLDASKRFYGALFGWTFRDIHASTTDYSVAFLDGRPVGGLFQRALPAGEHRRPAWLTFIAVRDVDAAKQSALEHGAKVVFEPRSYPQRGRQAVFADPAGAVFAVLASNSGDPPDLLAGPGEWIWSSLLVPDAGSDVAFYQALFGYDAFDMPSEDGLEHVILSSDNYARVSVNGLPEDSSRRHPHWLNFVRVLNASDASAKAVALGGRMLVEPHGDRHGGKIAVIADPAGAPVGLMEWSASESKEEPK